MRAISLAEFKIIIDSLAEQYPDATVDFVYPKMRAGKRVSVLSQLTKYTALLSDYSADSAIIRFFIDWAHDEPAVNKPDAS